MTRRVENRDIEISLERLRLIIMPQRPFQSFQRLGIVRDLIPRRRLVDELEMAVSFEVGFDEVSPGG